MCKNDVALGLAAAGPSLILLLAVLLAFWVIQRVWKNRGPTVHHYAQMSMALSTRELERALESAAALNSYNVNAPNDPRVRLTAISRLAPREYETSITEVARRFRAGQVLSIDLGNMDDHQAARLIDFCSGVAAVHSGWIFRVTEKVIILTPAD
jgi:FtsZ-interacting cell division protein YlmF